MNYTILKSEIDNDPESLGYAGKTDSEVADLLNQLRYVGGYDATFKTIISELGTGVADRLIESMELASSSSPSIKRILNALDIGVSVNLGDSVTRAMLDSFVSGGLGLTAEDATAIKALADNQVSRASQLGLSEVKPYDVRRAKQ